MLKHSRKILFSLAKIFIVFGLLFWMVKDDKLHLEDFPQYFANPYFLAATFGTWFVAALLLGGFRWYLLLKGSGITTPFYMILKLQLIGFFFNTTMPGAVSGDIIKAIYIVKHQNQSKKTPAMLSVLLDRIVGLIGLFLMGLLACLFNFTILWSHAATKSLMSFLFFIILGVCVFLTVVYSPHADEKDPFIRIFSAKLPGFVKIKQIYMSLRGYRKKPYVILVTIALSVLIQSIFLFYMNYCYELVNQTGPNFGLLASIFPFGILVTAVPIAPGGLGVGHVAFERLYSLVGLQHGANVFNLYAVGSLLMNLLGFIPYISMRSKITIPQSDQELG